MEDSPDALNDFLERERAMVRIERLKAALREALDGWYGLLTIGTNPGAKVSKRIHELRAQFLDDK